LHGKYKQTTIERRDVFGPRSKADIRQADSTVKKKRKTQF
jgi:hypothetical protein